LAAKKIAPFLKALSDFLCWTSTRYMSSLGLWL